MRRRSQLLDLPIALDRRAGNQPLQIHAGLRAAILGGRLASGIRLPSSRELAGQLGVRRNAIVEAYEHLQGDGLIETRLGAGTYVAARLPVRPATKKVAPYSVESAPAGAFALGRTHADAVLMRRLGSAMRRRVMTAGPTELGYGDPRGSEALRRQIAAYLAARRGILCDPGRIVIVSGTQHGLRLCADALLQPGDKVWMEDPGYPAAKRTLTAAKMRLVPVPVDAEGIDVAAGRRRDRTARAAYVTPSHQFPTGVTMSMARRGALIEWARDSNGWVFEDDYDSEYRYDGPPLPALAGLGGSDRVIYLGTFSKTLCAGLRLAYVVLPPAAIDAVVKARIAYDRFPPAFAADALADLMADGVIDDHMRRMRRRYRLARDTLVSTLAISAGASLRIVTPSQGLHLLACLPPGLPKDAAAQIRDSAGIQAWLLSETRLTPAPQDGFVLGFAGHDVADLIAAATALGSASRAYVRKTLRTGELRSP